MRWPDGDTLRTGVRSSHASISRGSRGKTSFGEENFLSPVARRAPGAADDRAILAGLRAVEREHGGPVEGAARALERWLDRRKPLATA